MSNTIIGLKELRENMEFYIAQVTKGRSFTVVRRSKPAFRIGPVDRDAGKWEEVTDFTKARKGGVKVSDLLARL